MTNQQEGPNARQDPDLAANLERIWEEIKEISRQVEQETRRSGRIARLRLQMRQLRRELTECRARLGKAVYAAQRQQGDAIALSDVEGFREAVDAIDELRERLDEKEDEVEGLREEKQAPPGRAAPASAGGES